MFFVGLVALKELYVCSQCTLADLEEVKRKSMSYAANLHLKLHGVLC